MYELNDKGKLVNVLLNLKARRGGKGVEDWGAGRFMRRNLRTCREMRSS
jgi:hypothetical protein